MGQRATTPTVARTATVVRAALYLRVSFDRAGGRSVEEQEYEGREVCTGEGWTVAEVYADPHRSASRFATKDRPNWDRLLVDMEAGAWDVLMLWESSRGDRVPESWFAMLSTARDLGILIHVVNHGRTYDVRKWRDWKVLAEDGVKAAVDSEETSDRVQRTKRKMLRDGLPDGQVTFGYRRVYDQGTGRLVREEEDPEKAPTVRAVFGRVAEGKPISVISRELGLSRIMVRRIALNFYYIGFRERDGELHKGSWPALVDEATFYAARRILLDPRRKTTRPGRAVHLLSYIARAGCGAFLQVMKRQRKLTYVCSGDQCAAARVEWLDEAITELIIERVSQRGDYDRLRRIGEDADRQALEARAEAERLRALLADWRASAARGETTPATMATVEPELTQKIADADGRADRACIPPQLRGLLGGPVEDVRQRWAGMPVAARRDTVRALLSITLLPAETARRGPATTLDLFRVKVEWRDL